ncbi:serine threonine kinase [Micractinium conductrix]|uniref:Serine threonine kinase n=1 Tax=Micractinium conductrix TaxID=554055 RepID=A0A2P6VPT0_9CHLO|nr:serine threonine kinase [Micractinium conductrix]|eukprot:PSC76103.1 serine threonine kinase [Micractinium conductrix]
MTFLKDRLAGALKAAGAAPPPFFCCSPMQRTTTQLEVAGMAGPLKLPLEETQVPLLRDLCEPFGPETARTWHLHPSKVSILNKRWPDKLEEAVRATRTLLDLRGDFEAELSGLLLHEAGATSLLHDGRREPGVFGCLAVMLPASYAGGELVVTATGPVLRSEERDTSSKSKSCFWAAFYTDCEHELRPATGTRLTLVYNLRATNQPVPRLPPSAVGVVLAVAEEWATAVATPGSAGHPPCVCAVLERGLQGINDPNDQHHYSYTAATLKHGVARLKPDDQAVIEVLLDACQAGAELDVCLVALTRTVAVRLYSETELAYEVLNYPEPDIENGSWQASKCVPLVGSAPAPAGGTLALPPACVVASSDFLSRMQPNGHGDKFRTKERTRACALQHPGREDELA